jgi:hypothetical protein
MFFCACSPTTLEWHMRQALAPLLFDDHDRAAAQARRRSPVAKATVSPAAQRKPPARAPVIRSTAFAPCSPIWPRWPKTQCASAPSWTRLCWPRRHSNGKRDG